MPQLGLGLGAQINESNSFDPDALRYFTTAGVTDATGRSQINTFIRGIKSLGLYNNMVAWPLRSTQNAGTGTTAYSLGGLGVYNGTLTNGPTWGTSGVAFDGTNDYIQTGYTGNLPKFTVFSTATPISGGAVLQVEAAKDIPASSREFFLRANVSGFVNSGIFNAGASVIVGPATQTTIRSFFFRGSSSVNKLRRNNEADQTGTTGNPVVGSSAFTIGARSDGAADYLKATVSATILFNTDLTDSQTSSMYTLYSTTLGSGLGLP